MGLVDSGTEVLKAISLDRYVKQLCSNCGSDSFAIYRNVDSNNYRVVCKRCGEEDIIPK